MHFFLMIVSPITMHNDCFTNHEDYFLKLIRDNKNLSDKYLDKLHKLNLNYISLFYISIYLCICSS